MVGMGAASCGVSQQGGQQGVRFGTGLGVVVLTDRARLHRDADLLFGPVVGRRQAVTRRGGSGMEKQLGFRSDPGMLSRRDQPPFHLLSAG